MSSLDAVRDETSARADHNIPGEFCSGCGRMLYIGADSNAGCVYNSQAIRRAFSRLAHIAGRSSYILPSLWTGLQGLTRPDQ